ncbi:MAG TPA: 4-demethylwyosine synthase TYW1 [Methanomicrobia archaeon]|nr:4-demethylwyosine synthase TYW1 [Methanomicrobia archaeon]
MRAISKYAEGALLTLERQGYHFVGTHQHSAVKTCLWLRKSLRGEGNCYKGKFYGIRAHRCVQMTPSIFCNQRCVHCWRPLEAVTVDRDEVAVIWDPPEEIVEACLQEQQRLISGFKGSAKTSGELFEEAMNPKHVAISLIGEPTLYPQLTELIEQFKARGMTTFLVTNGTKPEMIRSIRPYQLYLSLNAPDESTYQKTAHAHLWHQVLDSLEVMHQLKGQTRRVIRITCIAGMNMLNPAGYAALVGRASPDFIEVKAYMHLGYSRKRLTRAAMPPHARVRAFAAAIADELATVGYPYTVADESEISRVVLLAAQP